MAEYFSLWYCNLLEVSLALEIRSLIPSLGTKLGNKPTFCKWSFCKECFSLKSMPTYLCSSTCLVYVALKKHYNCEEAEQEPFVAYDKFMYKQADAGEALQNHCMCTSIGLSVRWAYFWEKDHNSQKYAHLPFLRSYLSSSATRGCIEITGSILLILIVFTQMHKYKLSYCDP